MANVHHFMDVNILNFKVYTRFHQLPVVDEYIDPQLTEISLAGGAFRGNAKVHCFHLISSIL
jgi:hypothetical protein